MAKQKTIYACTECGGQTLKWQGQCPHCQAWNSLIETIAEKSVSRFSPVSEIDQVQNLSDIEAREEPRYPTGLEELDRVFLIHVENRLERFALGLGEILREAQRIAQCAQIDHIFFSAVHAHITTC